MVVGAGPLYGRAWDAVRVCGCCTIHEALAFGAVVVAVIGTCVFVRGTGPFPRRAAWALRIGAGRAALKALATATVTVRVTRACAGGRERRVLARNTADAGRRASARGPDGHRLAVGTASAGRLGRHRKRAHRAVRARLGVVRG